jgi:hypothetical protein
MDALKYTKAFYRYRYNQDYFIKTNHDKSEGVNFVKLILEWSGGNKQKLNGEKIEKITSRLEEYLVQKTGKYINSRQRNSLKDTLMKMRRRFDQRTFKEIYEYCNT